MLPPYVILIGQVICWGGGLLLIGSGIIWLRRTRMKTEEMAREVQHASTERKITLEKMKPPNAVWPRAACTLGGCLLIVPFTGVFHVNYAWMKYKLEKSREYRAPRKQQTFDQHTGASLDLTAARRGFQTRLTAEIDAPQDGDAQLSPPPGAKLVQYPSGDLMLKAWVSEDASEDGKRPAVVFLHGGFALGNGDWEVLQPYRDAGFVTMTPSLRGENNNPGNFEFFYGEVSDALAAGRYLASLPNVDKERIHVAGHSVGGLLCVLAAESQSVFRSAAAFSPTALDVAAWIEEIVGGGRRSRGSLMGVDLLVFNYRKSQEVVLRNPHEFVAQLQIPLMIYFESGRTLEARGSFPHLAERAGKPVLVKRLLGTNHGTMLSPAVKATVSWLTLLNSIDPKTLTAENIEEAHSKRQADVFDLGKFLPADRAQFDDYAVRRLRYGMSEEGTEELLGPEGHFGMDPRGPKLKRLIEQKTSTGSPTRHKIWTNDTQLLIVELDDQELVHRVHTVPNINITRSDFYSKKRPAKRTAAQQQ